MIQFLTAAADSPVDMPFTEVLLKSALGYLSIFVVVGVIIGAIWILGKATSKKEK